MRVILGAAMMALATTAGAADTSSANYMLPYCKMTSQQVSAANPAVAFFSGQCFGIVEGISLVLGMAQQAERMGDAKRPSRRMAARQTA
jgi:hypothetical protein